MMSVILLKYVAFGFIDVYLAMNGPYLQNWNDYILWSSIIYLPTLPLSTGISMMLAFQLLNNDNALFKHTI